VQRFIIDVNKVVILFYLIIKFATQLLCNCEYRLMKHTIDRYLAKYIKYQFYYLLAAIVLFVIIPPFTLHLSFNAIIIHSTVSFVIINCVIILFENRKQVNFGYGILILTIAFTWFTMSPLLEGILIIKVIKSALLLVLFIATAFKVISFILKLKKVNAQVIAGSIATYLLFGLSGAMLFDMIDVLYPHSFKHSFNYGGGYDMVYFSFVTLSTLGYGDITPHTPQGQAVAILVSIVGQLYLAILMAMLVGKFLKDTDW